MAQRDEPITVVANHEDMAITREPIQECRSQLGIAKDGADSHSINPRLSLFSIYCGPIRRNSVTPGSFLDANTEV